MPGTSTVGEPCRHGPWPARECLVCSGDAGLAPIVGVVCGVLVVAGFVVVVAVLVVVLRRWWFT